MNRLFYLLAAFLILLIIVLLNSIFFGTNNYQQKSLLVEATNLQIIKNNDLKNQNDILEFEIENAQNQLNQDKDALLENATVKDILDSFGGKIIDESIKKVSQ